jgi:hypothetical protein
MSEVHRLVYVGLLASAHEKGKTHQTLKALGQRTMY